MQVKVAATYVLSCEYTYTYCYTQVNYYLKMKSSLSIFLRFLKGW